VKNYRSLKNHCFCLTDFVGCLVTTLFLPFWDISFFQVWFKLHVLCPKFNVKRYRNVKLTSSMGFSKFCIYLYSSLAIALSMRSM